MAKRGRHPSFGQITFAFAGFEGCVRGAIGVGFSPAFVTDGRVILLRRSIEPVAPGIFPGKISAIQCPAAICLTGERRPA
jgi:hypothetical protein